jgi:hypothetical protein
MEIKAADTAMQKDKDDGGPQMRHATRIPSLAIHLPTVYMADGVVLTLNVASLLAVAAEPKTAHGHLIRRWASVRSVPLTSRYMIFWRLQTHAHLFLAFSMFQDEVMPREGKRTMSGRVVLSMIEDNSWRTTFSTRVHGRDDRRP